MTGTAHNERPQNFLLIALLAIITVYTAYHENYFPLVSVFFLCTLVAAFGITIWLSMSISTRRLLSLVLGIFVIEYIKETIGVRAGMWKYHGGMGLYNFGVWSWVMGGLVAYTLTTRITIRLIRKLKLTPPKWLNPMILALIALLVPLLLGQYRAGAGGLFYAFYAILFAWGAYVSTRIDFSVLAGIIVTAWVVGAPSEYSGSAASGVWTFTHNPDFPPLFLLFGCWPLEILAQYSLSAYLADEPLNKDTFSHKGV